RTSCRAARPAAPGTVGAIEHPAVVEAAQPAPFNAPETQIGAAVRAMQSQQAEPPELVAEQHQLFAHDHQPQWRPVFRQIVERCDRLPKLAQQLAGRRTGTGAGHLLVVFLGQHGSSLPSRLVFVGRLERNATKRNRVETTWQIRVMRRGWDGSALDQSDYRCWHAS